MKGKLLIAERDDLMSKVTGLCKEFKKFGIDDLPKAEAKLQRINRYISAFSQLVTNIKEYNNSTATEKERILIDNEETGFNSLTDTIFEYYYTIKSAREDQLVTAKVQTHGEVRSSMSALAPIPLPKFDGDWESFKNIFDSMVDSKVQFSNSEKFHYLVSCLNDEAKAVIAQFPLNDENYVNAKKALESRYKSKRRTGANLIQELLDFPTGSKPDYNKLLCTFRNAIASLNLLKVPDLGDFIIFQILYSKVSKDVRIDFDKKQKDLSEFPKADELLNVIQQRMQMEQLNSLGTGTTSQSSNVSSSKSSNSSNSNTSKSNFNSHKKSSSLNIQVKTCPVCKGDHSIYQCPNFTKLPVSERFECVKNLNRCFQCLGNHPRNKCVSVHKCKECGMKSHNTLLHKPSRVVTENVMEEKVQDSKVIPTESLTCSQGQAVILYTAVVLAQNAAGFYTPLRAIVDPGSQRSFITEAAVQALGLSRKRDNTVVSGIGVQESLTKGRTELLIKSSQPHSQFSCKVSTLILSRICSDQPAFLVSDETRKRFSNLELADPTWYKPGKCDLLLSGDFYSSILSDEYPNVVKGNPTAVKTQLGWLIIGKGSKSTENTTALLTMSECCNLNNTVQRFFELEQVTPKVKPQCPEDVYVEQQYVRTVSREESGRFTVSLPWKPDATPLQENKFPPLKSALYLENRLMKNSELKESYRKGLQDNVEQGVMVPCTEKSAYILPQVLVEKPERTTTKLRICLNASSVDKSGESVNSRLFAGPPLQKDISHVITRFRLQNVAVSADIKAMFTQIVVNKQDRHAQHVLCKLDDNSELVEYELNRLVFGFSSSPFLAQRVLLSLCEQDGAKFPMACEAIRNSTFVDNIVSGAASTKEAAQLCQELTSLLAKGGFELRKWASNSSEVLGGLDPQHLESLSFSAAEPTAHLLGLNWQPMSDSFRFDVFSFDGPATKRSILSYCARVYDPMGFLLPFTLCMKAIVQACCRAGVGWDDELPENLQSQWLQNMSEVHLLSQVVIERHIPIDVSYLEIVGFADASNTGYAAVLYVVCRSEQTQVHMLKARSRVAPIKPTTINRLELCAATLMAELYHSMLPVTAPLNVKKCTFYTDSMCTLKWINTPPHRLKVFESNRVAFILENTNQCDWKHVCSELNVADPGSRGLSPAEFLQMSKSWFYGPSFLKLPSEQWPDTPLTEESEVEVQSAMLTQNSSSVPSLVTLLSERFSSLHKVKKAVAVWLRVFDFLKSKKKVAMRSGSISVDELKRSMLAMVKIEQRVHYPEALMSGKETAGNLSCLTPFVRDGVVHVGGRLSNASTLSASARHPMLIPGKSVLARLLCEDSHVATLHGGPLLMRASLQRKFWITGIGSLLKSVVFKCTRCYRFKAKPIAPVMEDLPACRLESVRPFLRVGVDMCGFFKVRDSARKKAPTHTKCYVAVFVCFATKAAHLEVVLDLSTDCFLAAFHKFVARRGLPHSVHSDCGSNFKKLAKDLKEIHEFYVNSSNELERQLSKLSVKWVFNPPAAPHYGGLWERLVGSFKHHLKRVIGTNVLTYQELDTLVVSIEGILNSRPLMPLPNDPAENSCFLTPGHFLVGGALNAVPEYPLDNVKHLDRWQMVRRAVQQFWSGFRNHVLQTMIPRRKWQSSSGPNLKVGDVVLIREEGSSPLNWPLGRVLEVVSTNQAGFARVVKVKVANGWLIRPVHKLSLFHASQEA